MKKAEGNAFWKHPRGWLRVIAATLIGLYLLAALFIIALRFVVLPHVNDYRDEISAYLSKTLKANVRIGEISRLGHLLAETHTEKRRNQF
jgi:hypothetical protein